MISVVLVNWNGWADTIGCIQSLLNSDSTCGSIIVVDNESTDDSMLAFECWANRQLELIPKGDEVEFLSLNGANHARRVKFVRYLESENCFLGLEDGQDKLTSHELVIYFVQSGRNGGFGFGCNVGMRLGHLLGASGYWLLNNDCVVNPHALGLVAKSIELRPNVIFGTILKYYYNPSRIQAIGGGYFNSLTGSVKTVTHPKKLRALNFINGASMILSDRCYMDLGGFDESIFMYFEENDLCIRANKSGYSFDILNFDVYHMHGGSQGKVPTANAWAQVLINKFYVLNKNFGWGLWTFVYFCTLVFSSLLPVGSLARQQGAKRALLHFLRGINK